MPTLSGFTRPTDPISLVVRIEINQKIMYNPNSGTAHSDCFFIYKEQ